jgi:hypothetical protein
MFGPVFLISPSTLERMITTATPSKTSAEIILLLVALLLKRPWEHVGVIMYGRDDCRNSGCGVGNRASVG